MGGLRSPRRLEEDRDGLIATQARSLGVVLVTNNVREFRKVKGLKIEAWP